MTPNLVDPTQPDVIFSGRVESLGHIELDLMNLVTIQFEY